MAQHHGKLSGALHWYHWVVVASSLILTFSAWYITSKQAEQKVADQFHFQADQIVQLVVERMQKYEEALWSGVAALNMMPDFTNRDDWRTFAGSLVIEDRYPGINGIGVIHYHTAETLPNYLTEQRRLLPDYQIHPKHNRDEYWPITYIEPQDINIQAVGLDMAHEINRYTAAVKSRDSGTAQITGPITLVQDAQKTPGFLFYAPWYTHSLPPDTIEARREAHIGLVYAPFIVNKLMDGALANSNRQLNISIYDDKHALYDEFTEPSENFDPEPLYTKTVTLDLYGRVWQFNIRSSTLFRENFRQSGPVIILVGGLIIDVMLLALFVVLARSNKRAVNYANEVTKDLLFNQQELEFVHGRLTGAMNAMLDGLIVVDG